MMRNEVGSDSAHDAIKTKGESAVSDVESPASGNGLVEQFSQLTDPKALAPGGGGDKPDVARVASPESGVGQAEAGLVGIAKPVTATMDSGTDANGAKSKQDGGATKMPAGEYGYKKNGVSGAFPAAAELLHQLK